MQFHYINTNEAHLQYGAYKKWLNLGCGFTNGEMKFGKKLGNFQPGHLVFMYVKQRGIKAMRWSWRNGTVLSSVKLRITLMYSMQTASFNPIAIAIQAIFQPVSLTLTYNDRENSNENDSSVYDSSHSDFT